MCLHARIIIEIVIFKPGVSILIAKLISAFHPLDCLGNICLNTLTCFLCKTYEIHCVSIAVFSLFQ